MPATKDQIADVFERHVSRYGYAKTSVEEVAAELRISKKTVYENFSSKKELFGYVVERMAAQSRRELAGAVEAIPTWGGKMEALVRIVLGAARAHIDETTAGDWNQEYEVAGAAFTNAMTSVMHDVIAGGVGAGEFAFSDVETATRLLGKMALEYVLMVREDPALDVDEALAAATRRFLG